MGSSDERLLIRNYGITLVVLVALLLVVCLVVCICRARRKAIKSSRVYEELEQLDELDAEEIKFKSILESKDLNPFAELNDDLEANGDKYSFLNGNFDDNDCIMDDFELNSKDMSRLDQLDQFRSNLMSGSAANAETDDNDGGEDGSANGDVEMKSIDNIRL